jgi:hypothetical protein
LNPKVGSKVKEAVRNIQVGKEKIMTSRARH